MTRWAVVVATDGNLLDEATRMLDEVARTATGAPDLFCFARDLDDTQQGRLARVPRLTVLPIGSGEVPVGPMPTYASEGEPSVFYARFECWSDRFAAYDTIVYLDVDTVVLGDLSPLTAYDFYASAEIDGSSPFVDEDDPALATLMEADGWRGPVGVRVNAGVFAIGRAWRTAEQRELLRRITDRYAPYLREGDQSVLVLWMHANGIAGSADASYNCQIRRTVGRPGGRAAVRRARVLHCNGMKLATQRVALRNARLWLGVPMVGRDLFVLTHRALFDDRKMRPRARRVLELGAGLRHLSLIHI